MKVYIPKHDGGAGYWIYEGYKAAWDSLGYDTEYIEDQMNLPGPPEATPDEYQVMLVEGALAQDDFGRLIPFLRKAKRVYLFVQPNKFPSPWGAHDNFISRSSDYFINEISELDNIYYWTFSDTSKTDYYYKWSAKNKIHYVPLAFDDINYKPVEDKKYGYDVCYVGSWANNGFDEKRKIMGSFFSELVKLKLKLGVFIATGMSIQEEANLLFNSKISLNIHDEYQHVLGLDTNERTFKSLGLNGFLISDKVEALGSLFPDVAMCSSPKEMAKNVEIFMDQDLTSIKEKNRSLVLKEHTYVRRVEGLLSL